MRKTILLIFLLTGSISLLPGMKNNSLKETTTPQPNLQKSIAAGKEVYKKYCISCHQADGGGVPNMSPPLINTSYVLGEKEKLVSVILNGLKNVDIDDETYNNPMPPLGSVLKNQQIADVLTYVRNSFGNKASMVTLPEVQAERAKNKAIPK